MDFRSRCQEGEKGQFSQGSLLEDVRAAVMEEVGARLDDRLRQLWRDAAAEVKKHERERERSMNELLEEAKSLQQKQKALQEENRALMKLLNSWTAQLADGKRERKSQAASGSVTPSTKVTSGSEGSPESDRESFPAPPGLEVQAVSLAHALGIEKEEEKEEAFVFKLTLRVADDADLGLCFSKKGEALEIVDIESGAAESWNRQCGSSGSPERVLQRGDLVVAVNEQSEPEQMMLEAKRKLVALQVLRVKTRHYEVQYPLAFPTGLGYGSPADWTFPWA